MMNANRKRIAVVGSGISGLSAAWLLAQRHAVTLYEAAPRLGGHVVRASPTVSSKWDDALLDAESAPGRIRLRAGERLDWVIGFHHDRAAMIEAIEWVDAIDAGKQARIEEVRIFASRDSPLGPWEPLATWKLTGGQTKRLALERPARASFVRFATAPADKAVTLVAPSVLRIFERPVAADYLSILGEWGFNGHRAVYEADLDQNYPNPFTIQRQQLITHCRKQTLQL